MKELCQRCSQSIASPVCNVLEFGVQRRIQKFSTHVWDYVEADGVKHLNVADIYGFRLDNSIAESTFSDPSDCCSQLDVCSSRDKPLQSSDFLPSFTQLDDDECESAARSEHGMHGKDAEPTIPQVSACRM
jgi:hypothetical protein